VVKEELKTGTLAARVRYLASLPAAAIVKAADRNFVVVASRLPVDRVEGPDGETSWRPSPGGLVTALEPVMRAAGGAWIGWSGDAGLEPGPFEANGLHLVGIGLSETEVRDYVPPELVVRPGPVVRQQPG